MFEFEPPADRDFPLGHFDARRYHLAEEARTTVSTRDPQHRPRGGSGLLRFARQPRLLLGAAALGAIVFGVVFGIDQTTGGTSSASAAVGVEVAPVRPGAASSTAGPARVITIDAAKAAEARARPHDIDIVGGSAAQRDLLRSILSRMPGASVTRVAIVPKIYRGQNGAGLETSAAPGDPLRADWEEMVLAGAFRDLSARQGLPTVVGLPPAAAIFNSEESATGVAAKVEAAAAAAGAEVADIKIYRPEGLAPAVVLRVKDPAAFLKRRLPGFLSVFGDRWRDYDGTFVEVLASDGSFVWAAGTSPVTSHGSVGTRPDLTGCSPIVNFFSTPSPCPVS